MIDYSVPLNLLRGKIRVGHVPSLILVIRLRQRGWRNIVIKGHLFGFPSFELVNF